MSLPFSSQTRIGQEMQKLGNKTRRFLRCNKFRHRKFVVTEDMGAGHSAPKAKALIFQTKENSAKHRTARLVRDSVQGHTNVLFASLLQKLFCVLHHLDHPSSHSF